MRRERRHRQCRRPRRPPFAQSPRGAEEYEKLRVRQAEEAQRSVRDALPAHGLQPLVDLPLDLIGNLGRRLGVLRAWHSNAFGRAEPSLRPSGQKSCAGLLRTVLPQSRVVTESVEVPVVSLRGGEK